LVICVLAAGLVTAATSASALQSQQTDWYTNDNPTYGPGGAKRGWRGGDPESTGNGYGPSRYSNNSNYAYASAASPPGDSWNPTGSWARWDMGTRVGNQEIQVYVPKNHATARVRYKITLRRPGS